MGLRTHGLMDEMLQFLSPLVCDSQIYVPVDVFWGSIGCCSVFLHVDMQWGRRVTCCTRLGIIIIQQQQGDKQIVHIVWESPQILSGSPSVR